MKLREDTFNLTRCARAARGAAGSGGVAEADVVGLHRLQTPQLRARRKAVMVPRAKERSPVVGVQRLGARCCGGWGTAA